MNLLNSLTPLQWIILAAVPPAILALYFLKLRRQPLEVPSTYLWSRTIEDLHVNSIWQRLRQSLLLFLQLLLIALAMIACLRPGWRGEKQTGERAIYLIDTSASMSATDVSPNRLEVAKRQVIGMIDQMRSSDVAMVISFSDVARVEQSFTDNRSTLRQKVNRLQGTNRPSDLSEALRAAAGLANPGRSSEQGNMNDVQVAEALPATMYIFSDGGFAAVPDFSLGNLEPNYVPIGLKASDNVGIVAFSTDRNPDKPGEIQAFARLQNAGAEDAEVEAELFLNDTLVDAVKVKVPAGGGAGAEFKLDDLDRGVLKLQLDRVDHLALDNVAYTAINPPRQARVLLVTPGNEPLVWALQTDEVAGFAVVEFAEPPVLETKPHQDLAAAGYYDLIVYDRCVPKIIPQANTLFIGRLPPLDTWKAGQSEISPLFIDSDRNHPLMQFIDMGNVTVLEGFAVTPPAGGASLIDADIGTVFGIGPREGFEDAVLGFEIIGSNEKGEWEPKTDWPKRRSFPVFAMNFVRYLGGVTISTTTPTVKPGQPIVLRTDLPVDRIEVQSPSRQKKTVLREGQNAFVYVDTDLLGVYDVFEGRATTPSRQFSVNLFDARESDLTPRENIELGHEEVQGQVGFEPVRKELWKWILLAGMGVLIFEWYVYNRRVYF
jgi:hypothetical protein